MDWTDFFDIGVKLFDTGLKAYNFFDQKDAREDADRRARDAGIAAADKRATIAVESAEMQATLLQAQGEMFLAIGEFNAQIFETQADIALDLAAREIAIIGENAEIAKTMVTRDFEETQSSVVAAVGASGFQLSGSPVYVMLDNAAEADYQLSIIDWQATVAQENAQIKGDLAAWNANVNASRERFVSQMQASMKFMEAQLVTEFAADVAEAEREAATMLS